MTIKHYALLVLVDAIRGQRVREGYRSKEKDQISET